MSSFLRRAWRFSSAGDAPAQQRMLQHLTPEGTVDWKTVLSPEVAREVMAERGHETLRFGPMKPVGLTNPHHPEVKPYAVVQLRRDNALGTLYNIVGFQTKMKYGAQVEVLKMIPGLQDARFARLGGIHRNTFINSPTFLDAQMRLKSRPHIRFAGQITGVEGYVESAAMGLLAGRMAASRAPPSPRTPPDPLPDPHPPPPHPRPH